ncbi:MAG: TraR/DksA C4-type zinc finger protein [Alphaproteobacteria bacterium]|nr:TraR/DksA C4-type zinc finger protein [Alphaproteobacteria bacterium]HJM62001.1 TraR/DksA C4-type zinc finger protein [Alphaproteobacteria bacterium]
MQVLKITLDAGGAVPWHLQRYVECANCGEVIGGMRLVVLPYSNICIDCAIR